MPDWPGLSDQRVLVAGGGSSIGAALLAEFANGAVLGIADLTTEGLDTRVCAARAEDLRDADACRRTVRAIRDELGGLDVFVHCIGVNDWRPLEEYGADDWDRIIAVNLTSAFHTAIEAAVGMRKQNYGRTVFFSSVAGRSGHKLHGPYAATKGAINQLTRVLAHEYAAYGVTASAVVPGYMETARTKRYLEDNPSKRKALIDLIPMGRFGMLREAVEPVLLLCSERASFITGTGPVCLWRSQYCVRWTTMMQRRFEVPASHMVPLVCLEIESEDWCP